MNPSFFKELTKTLLSSNTTLVAVSKIQPNAKILSLYDLGQRDFGENYVQELVAKEAQLPKDIRWHFIGNLQRNKVKYIAPFVTLIEGVDSLKLLQEIDKQAARNNRIIDCLLQVHIAKEETKFGWDAQELQDFFDSGLQFNHVNICGLMGMATFSDDLSIVRSEFKALKSLFDQYQSFFKKPVNSGLPAHPILSMGMSGDYEMAIEEGSNMVRIGSLLFGARQ